MATTISSMRPLLRNEINVPGFAQIPDVTNSDLDGYLKNGFWHLRLRSVMSSYNLDDGSGLTPPASEDVIYQASNEGDLPVELQHLVALAGGFRMIRLKTLNLAVNFRAKAGPVEYEQQASATTLRAVLASLEAELVQLSELYASAWGNAGFYYMDGVLQREASELGGLVAIL